MIGSPTLSTTTGLLASGSPFRSGFSCRAARFETPRVMRNAIFYRDKLVRKTGIAKSEVEFPVAKL